MINDPFKQLQETDITACPTCGYLRDTLAYEDLPSDAKFELGNPDGDNNFYLYCSTCDKYTMGGFGGLSFDIDQPPKSSTFSAQPSLNAVCPCGSGKKYKRCCGKSLK
ncbi:MAG: SEC-C domain-containing protein [Sphingobacteriales bacterium]|nr:SEC-C domain-containing protein [Sphingobacteriales bacterium]